MALEHGNHHLIDKKILVTVFSCFHNHTKPFCKVSPYFHTSNDIAWLVVEMVLLPVKFLLGKWK